MPRSFETLSPGNGTACLQRDYADDTQVEQCLQAALQGQHHWQSLPIRERARYCRDIICDIERHSDLIAAEISMMMGRPVSQAASEVASFAERGRHMVNIAEAALASKVIEQLPGHKRYIAHVPLGTCLIVAPWNYPYLTTVNSLIPALMAGNCVILKPSTQTPLCAERIAEACVSAGLPEGVFSYLYLDHPQTLSLAADQRIDHVSFTGSNRGGSEIETALAGHYKHLTLELGGKDPAYVRADADLELAVSSILDGTFFNAGQSCCAIERLYLHQSIYERFIELATEQAYQYQPGPPDEPETRLGPLVSGAAADHVRAQRDDALAKGGIALLDPSRFPADQPGSPYLAPQLIANANHQMDLMSEETFGPLLGIQKVADDEEAIALMNDSRYGLSAAIYSSNIDRAAEIGGQLQCGTLFLNRCDYLDPALVWSGVKQSGRGCSLSVLGYEQLTRPKSYYLNCPQPDQSGETV